MANDHLAFRRRNIYERKAIRFVRGETITIDSDRSGEQENDDVTDDATLARHRHTHFGCLRQFSRRNGLKIMPLGSPYITAGELTVLRWLAEAQRQVGLCTCHLGDLGLKASIRNCAGILRELGVLLPSQTLYIFAEPEDCLPLAEAFDGRPADQNMGYHGHHTI